jgi:putative ABC transport system permease protein
MNLDSHLDTIRQDLRYAFHGLPRNRSFTLAAIFAIALAVGATTAVFSVVDRILFRGLPYVHDERLVSLGIVAPPIDSQEFLFAGTYHRWQQAQKPFDALTSWTGIVDCDLTVPNFPLRLSCARVESTFLPTLGIRPLVGRSFSRDEDKPGASGVVLLSYGLWQSRFGGDPGVLGKSIDLDGSLTRVIGTLPADFELPTLGHADLLVPEALPEGAESQRLVGPLALLRPGITIEQARAALEPLYREFLESVPPEFKKALPLRMQFLRERQIQDARLASWILLGSVMAVLLIACANVAGLLLARAAHRSRDLAVRAALGASRGRLIRQSLTESLLLGATGGMLGCPLAWLFLRLFLSIAPEGILRLQQASLDLRVLLFVLAVSLASGTAFGLAPAFQTPQVGFLTGSRTVGTSCNLFRQLLVTAQIAVCLVLLTGAGLLLESLWSLQNAPLGMQTESVLTASFVLGKERYSDDSRQLAFFEELENRLKRLPGVTAAAVTDSLPPAGITRSRPFTALEVPGRPRLQDGMGGTVIWRYVTPGYFAALNIPILRGRAFVEQDRDPGEEIAILSQSLAARLFPNENPLGKHVDGTVVGIAGEVNNNGLSAKADDEYYIVRKHSTDGVFQNQMPPYGWRKASVVIRSPMNTQAVANLLRAQIATLDPTLPIAMETMNHKVSKLAQRPRFNAVLLGLFAGMGVMLAAIGLYGLISFLVAQRTQEIGVRMALGATPGQIARLVLAHAARWALAGIALGLIASFWATKALAALLFQVPEKDPITMGAAITLLVVVALLAAWIPSRRAALVDPMLALQHE